MTFNRRNFIQGMSAGFVASILPKAAEAFANESVRALRMYNIHTGESVFTPYWRNGQFDQAGLRQLNHFFRDRRNGQVHHIDTDVFDIIYALQTSLGRRDEAVHLISGYRSPQTNAMLRRNSSGVASRSLHLDGRAADIRLPGVDLSTLRRQAVSLKAGGVGYYPRSNFVHVDNGRVRYW